VSGAKAAQVAQLVEQRIENPRVTGSIPVLGTIFAPSIKTVHWPSTFGLDVWKLPSHGWNVPKLRSRWVIWGLDSAGKIAVAHLIGAMGLNGTVALAAGETAAAADWHIAVNCGA
jgi:hypothetical protein